MAMDISKTMAYSMKISTKMPIYDVITTTVYIEKDIPALRMSDGKLWWKQKTYKNFAKQSCGLSNREFYDILQVCKEAIINTKKEVLLFENDSFEVQEFLKKLHDTWVEEIV
jgi:serine/threonine-protein kinase HipA